MITVITADAIKAIVGWDTPIATITHVVIKSTTKYVRPVISVALDTRRLHTRHIDIVTFNDSGKIYMNNYGDPTYFAEDYVGVLITF